MSIPTEILKCNLFAYTAGMGGLSGFRQCILFNYYADETSTVNGLFLMPQFMPSVGA